MYMNIVGGIFILVIGIITIFASANLYLYEKPVEDLVAVSLIVLLFVFGLFLCVAGGFSIAERDIPHKHNVIIEKTTHMCECPHCPSKQ